MKKPSTKKIRSLLPKGKGQILNHSSTILLVVETDRGRAIAHILGPKRKSPAKIDADGFRRHDGEPILLHKGWWKVPDFFRADIFEIGNGFLIPVSVMLPVDDEHFGDYQVDTQKDWGEDLTYVTAIIKTKRKKTIGYIVEHRDRISVPEAIKLAKAGRLDNVVVFQRNGKMYLRTKKNMVIDDNLTA